MAWVSALRPVHGLRPCCAGGGRWGIPSSKEGLGCHHQKNVRKFSLKILPSGAMSAKKLASVGVENDTVKREKLVLPAA